MGESYTIGGDYGGVALFGNTRVGYINSSSYLQNYFAEALDEETKAGIVENYSKDLFFNKYKDTYAYHVLHTNNLIGDPEFEIWRGKPSLSDVSLTHYYGSFNISGSSLSDAIVTIYSGQNTANNIILTGSNQNNVTTYGVSYDLVLCSIWKTGTLPIISLFGENSLVSTKYDFIVRNAQIGLTDSFKILNGGNVNIEAIDYIELGDFFQIDAGGKANLKSKQKITVGGIVKSNGSLYLSGEEVIFREGFAVEKGGKLIIE